MDYILFHEHIQLPPFFSHTHALINIAYVNKRAYWFWAVLCVPVYWQMYVVCANFRICLHTACHGPLTLHFAARFLQRFTKLMLLCFFAWAKLIGANCCSL